MSPKEVADEVSSKVNKLITLKKYKVREQELILRAYEEDKAICALYNQKSKWVVPPETVEQVQNSFNYLIHIEATLYSTVKIIKRNGTYRLRYCVHDKEVITGDFKTRDDAAKWFLTGGR